MNFFTGHKESKVGSAGAFISGLGMISQGIGTGIAGATQGTAMCGSKPACISFKPDSACAKRKQAFQDCVSRSLDLAESAQQSEKIRLQESSKRRNTIIIVGAVSLAVVIVTILIVKK